MVLADSRTPSEAIPYLRRFAQEAPRDKYASDRPGWRRRWRASEDLSDDWRNNDQ